ncbi:MAG: class I SAM-dependent methyltransferase [Acidobacteriota bacterium]
MNRTRTPYIPALRYAWLTALYDPLLQVTLREYTFKLRLIEQAAIQQGCNLLDLGCGTATLTLLVKRLHPETQVVGLDADPKALEIARAKRAQSRLDVGLDLGLSMKLPYPDCYFDRVLSSLFFHHLTTENKRRTLEEIFRVLRPTGELHVADWGKAQNSLMRAAFLLVQMLDGFETTSGNVRGELLDTFRSAGFQDVSETCRYMTVFGTLSLYQARKPGLRCSEV